MLMTEQMWKGLHVTPLREWHPGLYRSFFLRLGLRPQPTRLFCNIKIKTYSVCGTFFSNILALFIGKIGKVAKLPPRHCTLFPLNALIDFRIWNLSRSRVWGRDWAPFLKTNNSIKLFKKDFVRLNISSKFIIWPRTSIFFAILYKNTMPGLTQLLTLCLCSPNLRLLIRRIRTN